MSPIDFEALREGGPRCPSDVTLHRLRAGELRDDAATAARTHVGGCPACATRLERQEQGFGAWAEPDPVAMLAAIRRGVDERRSEGLAARAARWVRLALAPLAVVAAAGLVLYVRPGGDVDGPGGVRTKGAVGLHVFRQVDGAAVEAFSGDAFRPGEPIRFQVDLAHESVVQIVGVEADGELYVVWPRPAGAAKLPAGRSQEVPGAVTLDDAPGAETFHLVACPPAVAAPACESRGVSSPPQCAEGCLSASFVLEKRP